MGLLLKTPINKATEKECLQCKSLYFEELQCKQKQLLEYKSKLEQVNNELLETNKAVSILARNIDRNRRETEHSIVTAINTKLIPIIEDLRNAKKLESVRDHLDILAVNLQTMVSGLNGGTNLKIDLTPTEMRVAMMIKSGLSSEKIADKLFISLHTVKTHRRNIRKKLKITNSRINLTSYLQSVIW